jgi:peptidoglycan/LPS O-acetylase OafA/YrhL
MSATPQLRLSSTTGFYSERIDHLRFFAAVLVLWWHYAAELPKDVFDPLWVPRNPFWSLFDEGHVGVALFFTLSGYLFYFITWQRQVSYRGFIFNRILRIGPLMVFWVLLQTGLGLPQNMTAVDLVVALLTTFGKLPGVGWSVLIEFQFYLLFPLLLQFIRKNGLRYIWAFLLLLFVLRSCCSLYGGPTREIGYNTIFGHMDQFLFGMLAAHWVLTGRGFRGQFLIALVAGLLIIIASTHYLNIIGGLRETAYSGAWVWLPLAQGIGWAAFIAGYVKIDGVPRIPLLTRGLAHCGEWSYSLYWSHLTILAGIRGLSNIGIPTYPPHHFNTAINIFLVYAIPLTCAFSALSFYVIERPFIEMRRSYAGAPVPTS